MDSKILFYNEMLQKHWRFGIGVVIFLACIAIGLAAFCCKMKQPIWAVVSVALFAVLLSLGYYFALYPIQRDMEKMSYTVYEGEFYVEEYYSAVRSGTYILIQEKGGKDSVRYKVVCDDLSVESDCHYYGYFVYSQNSKLLVDFLAETVIK